MTIEERFERIEHLTAGIAEERRKDREEYKTLWRDTQRQIDDTARTVAALARDLISLSGTVGELTIRIRDLAEESRAANQRIEDRIDSLVSSMGELIPKLVQQPPNRT